MDLTLFILFILSATGGHLGCVQIWTIIDKAGLYNHGHGCLLHYGQTFSSHSNNFILGIDVLIKSNISFNLLGGVVEDLSDT